MLCSLSMTWLIAEADSSTLTSEHIRFNPSTDHSETVAVKRRRKMRRMRGENEWGESVTRDVQTNVRTGEASIPPDLWTHSHKSWIYIYKIRIGMTFKLINKILRVCVRVNSVIYFSLKDIKYTSKKIFNYLMEQTMFLHEPLVRSNIWANWD